MRFFASPVLALAGLATWNFSGCGNGNSQPGGSKKGKDANRKISHTSKTVSDPPGKKRNHKVHARGRRMKPIVITPDDTTTEDEPKRPNVPSAPQLPARVKVRLSAVDFGLLTVSDPESDESTVMIRRGYKEGGSLQYLAVKYSRMASLDQEYEILTRLFSMGVLESVVPITLSSPLIDGPFSVAPGKALVMEYGGISLRQIVRDSRREFSAVDYAELARSMVSLLQSLQYRRVAHGAINWSHVLVRSTNFRAVRFAGWKTGILDASPSDLAGDMRSVCRVLLEIQQKWSDGMTMKSCFPRYARFISSLHPFDSVAKKIEAIFLDQRQPPDFSVLDQLLNQMVNAGKALTVGNEGVPKPLGCLGRLMTYTLWPPKDPLDAFFANVYKKNIDETLIAESLNQVAASQINEQYLMLVRWTEVGGNTVLRLENDVSNDDGYVLYQSEANWLVKQQVQQVMGGNSLRAQYAMMKYARGQSGLDNVVEVTDWIPRKKFASPIGPQTLVMSLEEPHTSILGSVGVAQPEIDAFKIFLNLVTSLEQIHARNIVYNNVFADTLLLESIEKIFLFDFSKAEYVSRGTKFDGDNLIHEMSVDELIEKHISPFALEDMDKGPSMRDDLFMAFELLMDLLAGNNRLWSQFLKTRARKAIADFEEAFGGAAITSLPPSGDSIVRTLKFTLGDGLIKDFINANMDVEQETKKAIIDALHELLASISGLRGFHEKPNYQYLRQSTSRYLNSIATPIEITH
jgi:hypothetical protein